MPPQSKCEQHQVGDPADAEGDTGGTKKKFHSSAVSVADRVGPPDEHSQHQTLSR